MNDESFECLARPVSVRIRVDDAAVAIVKTIRVGRRTIRLPARDLPLTKSSFVELEFFDGADRLIVPACVTQVDTEELTLAYEQTGKIFEHWYNENRATA